ncbi:putative hydrolase nit2 [Neolecta irregularis DAH-3]|uniref:Putative hydrolase nit2 n=1 Tax=Neolecta irregularis (strain DAH-3) TaxID=1198029 RepID=A0A1U7LIR9_NEOID|nr:putative hydrolase nit2 [Neolecta irregularis DAH-3]|eukprot:OLL22421.1 putative hydrolase nit2 [Neolecta irregularis DAH-3]
MVLAAVGQFCAISRISANLLACKDIIEKASKAGAKVVFLPEASDFICTRGIDESLQLVASNEHQLFVSGMREIARETMTSLSVGIHELSKTPGKLVNTSLYIDQTGDITYRYHKLHLFDVNIANGPVLKESDSVEHGKSVLPPFKSPIGRLGMAICYDIRFPEMSLRLRSLGADVISFPSAFTIKTGTAHWEPLLRARAIDSQCWIMAAAQIGWHDGDRKRGSWGHAMIVDPWGTVVAQCPEINEPCFSIANINHDITSRVRKV